MIRKTEHRIYLASVLVNYASNALSGKDGPLRGFLLPYWIPGFEAPPCLESFHYLKKRKGQVAERVLRDFPAHKKIFLDSGAFSAMTLGSEIAVDDYIAFAKQHRDRFDPVVVLDVIANAEATYENWMRMLDAGLDAFPVFHAFSPRSALDKILSHDPPMIGLGPARLPTMRALQWLDEIWPLLVDHQGKPRMHVHGFALTQVEVLSRYPWGSADSSTWYHIARKGRIPVRVMGRFVRLAVSDQSERSFDLTENVISYFKLTDTEKDAVHAYIEELRQQTRIDEALDVAGLPPLSMDTLRTSYYHRDFVCQYFYSKITPTLIPDRLSLERFHEELL